MESIKFEIGAQFITIEDCLNFFEQGISTEINDGIAVTFIKE